MVLKEDETPKVEKLEELISPYIEQDKKIINTKITNITQPGENNGSTILLVDLILENGAKLHEQLNIFAKLIPPSEFFQKLFNCQLTFKLEAAFFEEIVPTLKNFQREKGITKVMDFFPRFYGARSNLNNSDVVDTNGAILLENLKVSGFVNLDRRIGLDCESAKFIIKDLAEFHATPIAIKIQKPTLFEEKIKTYLATFLPESEKFDNSAAERNISKIIKSRENFVPVIEKVENYFRYIIDIDREYREPFATIVHRDMWTNNFMVQLEGQKIVKNKFVDFQRYAYDSPVKDLLFFLCTSVQFDVLKENFDSLLNYYHEKLIIILRKLGCSTTEFSYERFLDEITHCGRKEIGHILYMVLFVAFRDKDLAGNVINPADITNDMILPDVLERAWWIVQEFEQRKWLDQ